MDMKKVEELAKARGLELAEKHLNEGAKDLAHFAIDLFKVLVDESENKIDDVAFAAVEGVARDMADKIEVSL